MKDVRNGEQYIMLFNNSILEVVKIDCDRDCILL